MHLIQSHRGLCVLTLIGLFLGVFTTKVGWAIGIYDVNVETTGISGLSGFLAFDLIAGDSVTPNNTVTITSLATDGTLADASDFSFQDSAFPGPERGITFGTVLSFTLELTENFVAPGVPDAFSFFLLDDTFFPIFPTNDILGSSLFAIDIDGTPGGNLTTFSADPPIQDVSWNVTEQQQRPPVIPEPTTLILFATALVAFAITVRHRQYKRWLSQD